MGAITAPAVERGFPAPYFGGKRHAAHLVWRALGEEDIQHYIEPFCGTAAVLLAVPARATRLETINDADGYVVNALRALKHAPDAVAEHADWPMSEADMHARHLALLNEAKPDVRLLMTDPYYYDARAAGWWIWGLCCAIGPVWCTGRGRWTRELILGEAEMSDAPGIDMQIPFLGCRGRGVFRVAERRRDLLLEWFRQISQRLDQVRITCGNWDRVLSDAVLFAASRGDSARVGIFLDPPYVQENRCERVYVEDNDVAGDVYRWGVEHGDDPRLRIVMAGWEGDFDPPPGWTSTGWNRPGGNGYGNMSGRQTQALERLWFSPHCLPVERYRFAGDLFGGLGGEDGAEEG